MNRSAATSLALHGRIASHDGVPARESHQPTIWIPVACCWLLMLLTFSLPDRIAHAALPDAVALAKLVVRAIVLGVLTLLILRQWNSPRRKHVMRLLLPWFVFAGWAILSTCWSPLKSVSLGQAGSLVVLLLLACEVALCTGDGDVEQMLKHLTLALIVACALLLALFLVVPGSGSLTRAGNGLLHATNASATASIGCVLLIATRMLYGWKWSRAMLVPGLVICGATLIFAHSRTAVAVTGVVIIGLMACLAPFWRAVAMVSAGVGGAMYLATDLYLGVTDSLLNWLATYTARGQTADQLVKLSGREEMWTVMWDSFLESPWIGHGYFVSSSAGELYIWYAWTNWTAHNFWLQILVSTGVVGAALMACALAGLVVRLLSRVTRGAGEWRFAVLVGALLAWQFGWGINNESFAGPLQPESVVFFVILGLAVGRLAEARLARRGQRANGFSRQQNLATR